MEKYELIKSSRTQFGPNIMYRIRALRNFGDVRKGDIGGWVESESNLAHEGVCWIYDNAMVNSGGRVHNDAKLYDDAQVFENGYVYGNAEIHDKAVVAYEGMVYGNAKLYDETWVYNKGQVFDDAQLFDKSKVCHEAVVYDTAQLFDIATITHHADVSGNARVSGKTMVTGAETRIDENAFIFSDDDWITIGPIGNCNYLTAFKQKDNSIYINGSYMARPIDECIRRISKWKKLREHEDAYKACIQLIQAKLTGG